MRSRMIKRQRKNLRRLWRRNRRDGFRIVRKGGWPEDRFADPFRTEVLSCGEPAAEWGAMTVEEAIERFIRYKSLTLKDSSLDRLEQAIADLFPLPPACRPVHRQIKQLRNPAAWTGWSRLQDAILSPGSGDIPAMHLTIQSIMTS